MKIFWIFLFVLFTNSALGRQKTNIPRDTSFTLQSTFIKEKKKFPFITIADSLLSKNLLLKGNLVYKKIGDRALHLDIIYPKKKIKNGYPAVILIHGGGWRSGDRSQTIAIAKKIAESGYVTVAVEYRLSLEAAYPAGLQDVRSAIRWMRENAKKYRINSNKIAAMGFSSGGQMAALLGTTNGDKKYDGPTADSKIAGDIQAVIDVDGVLAFHHPESSESVVAAQWLGGTYLDKPEIWNEASALSHVDKNSVPIIFINSSTPRFHGGRDDMVKKLNSFNIYSEIHEFPNTPHPFWFFNPWFSPTVNYTIKFLDRVFK
ncbi:alpha/beta hydrolase [Pedobacter cryophilus]|uniref:Alpha/beta hydrolase n=1 Tax=Pedobacter cryophilus TaxID=2571271 RepID=A0A4U1C547_9SPHI|nr:alpha/beta hydrolase [Pedobacter cryophilus]TKC00499.1 alpha/beta hydrolase [Pedobacter cryophilus]